MAKKLLIIVIILSIFITTSCWSRKEIEDLGFIMGMGISKTDAGLYSIAAQLANPEAIASENPDQREIYTIIEAEGGTIFDALRNLSLESSRRLYFPHLVALVIDEKIAKNGMSEVVGLLVQDEEVRQGFYVFVSKVAPKDILDTPNTIGLLPAIALQEFAERQGAASKVYVSDFKSTLEASNNEVINYVTTLVELEPPPTEGEMELLKLTQIAVFDHDRLVGYLDLEQGQGYNFLTNNFDNGLIFFEKKTSNDLLTIEMLKSRTEVTPQYKNKEISFEVKVKASGNIAERTPHTTPPHELSILEVESQLNQVIEDKIYNVICAAQNEFEVDIFNFSAFFARKYPKEFQKYKNQWNSVFAQTEISVEVATEVIHSALKLNEGDD
ncbi:Ger(x)C family spore germination protein [Proteinivorax hydrogeniformans]|uniref:Ger(X)C family spore germination protein n=1 Tax=Proteinivorax hydrogeniformans TaxID=1826727 RepID=A0AAU8HQJ0_9FIRM